MKAGSAGVAPESGHRRLLLLSCCWSCVARWGNVSGMFLRQRAGAIARSRPEDSGQDSSPAAGRRALDFLELRRESLQTLWHWELAAHDGAARSDAGGRPEKTTGNATSLSNETTAFLRALRPCARCQSYERFGEGQDGGYVMCGEDQMRREVKAAYSFGVRGFDGWGTDVSTRFHGIPVHEYDCFNTNRPTGPVHSCGGSSSSCNLIFHPQCLDAGESSNQRFKTATAKTKKETTPAFQKLHEILVENGHVAAGRAAVAALASPLAPVRDSSNRAEKEAPPSLLGKFDIEGAEWGAFAEASKEDLQRFRQLVVEFHNLGTLEKHAAYRKAIDTILSAGFVVVHLHGNNCCGVVDFDGGRYQAPKVLEVTFVNQKAHATTAIECIAKPERLRQDGKNIKSKPDLPRKFVATLPASF